MMPNTEPSSSTELSWESVASLADMRVAHSLAELLQAELIPARVISSTHWASAVPCWDVQVPPDQVASAERLMASSQLTDAELTYLATGKIDGE